MNFDTSLTKAFASLSVSSPSESLAVPESASQASSSFSSVFTAFPPDSAASPFAFTISRNVSRVTIGTADAAKAKDDAAAEAETSHRVVLRLLGTVIYDAIPCVNKSLINVIVEYGCEGPEFYFDEGQRLLDIGRESDAYRHFSESALYHNHRSSQREAAKILLSGKDIGFIPTRDDALSLLRMAASNSDASTTDWFLLASELEKSGLQEHDKEAVKFYTMGTEGGDPNASYHLGRMTFEGRAQTASPHENMRAAISLLKRPAEPSVGDQSLEASLYANMLRAHIYTTIRNLGLQTPEENCDNLAFHCLLEASSRGFPEAQLLLTSLCGTGKGCPYGVDLTKARSWCRQASKAGWGPQDDASVFIAKYLVALPTDEERASFLKFVLPHLEFHSRLFVEGSHNKIVKCFFEREPVLLEVIDLSQLGEALKACRSSPDYLGITWNIELLDSSGKRVKLPLVKVKRLTTAKPDDPMPQ